jgi:hypothetical protein
MFTLTCVDLGPAVPAVPTVRDCKDTRERAPSSGASLSGPPQNGARGAMLNTFPAPEIAPKPIFFHVHENDFLTMETTFLNVAMS